MKAIVVYESFWGNTAAIARAVAEGLGSGAEAMMVSAAQAVTEPIDLIVAGAPLLGFALPTEAMRDSLAKPQPGAPRPADLSQPSMASWLASLPMGSGASTAFETRIWWSPGSAAKTIAKRLAASGYRQVAEPERFLVIGRYGPVKDGEIERARRWGADLAGKMG